MISRKRLRLAGIPLLCAGVFMLIFAAFISTTPTKAGNATPVNDTAICTPVPTSMPHPTNGPGGQQPTNVPTNAPNNTPVPPTNVPTNAPNNTPVPPTNAPNNTPVPPTNGPGGQQPTSAPGNTNNSGNTGAGAQQGVSGGANVAGPAAPGAVNAQTQGGVVLPALGGARVAWKPINASGAVCPDWLVYHTDRTGDWEIFRLGDIPGKPSANADLSQGVGKNIDDIGASLSPDRQWITFASNRNGNWEIYVASTDGTTRQRVTYHSPATSTDPVWSPDGSSIVYESNLRGNWDLYVFNVQSGKEKRLTSDSSVHLNPYWSPDSQSVVYEQVENGFSQIFKLDLKTLKPAKLSDGKGNDRNPTYSRDGKQVAFFSYRDGTNSVLYVMNADGTGVMPISDKAGSALNHSWSPDGTLIAYQLKQGDDLGVYVYQFSSGKTRHVTDSHSANYAPTWYCNSNTLVFTSDVTGNPNLFMTPALPIDAKAIDVKSEAKQLTTGKMANQYAANTPPEEDASTFGPQDQMVALPQLGGSAACGKSTYAKIADSGTGFPVISTEACSSKSK